MEIIGSICIHRQGEEWLRQRSVAISEHFRCLCRRIVERVFVEMIWPGSTCPADKIHRVGLSTEDRISDRCAGRRLPRHSDADGGGGSHRKYPPLRNPGSLWVWRVICHPHPAQKLCPFSNGGRRT